MDWTIPVIIFQLIFFQVILSIDNAAVLGSLVALLPDDRPVYWPKALKKVGDWMHPILGNQRTAALRVGLVGAYLAQGLMLFLATQISQAPWVKVLGAFYLVWLSFDNLSEEKKEEAEEENLAREARNKGFWSIVLTVELSDIVFSLDNIVTAVAITDRFWLVVIGVFIGILLMRVAAGWFSYWVDREPILKKAAYVLILVIGAEILVSEFGDIQINAWLRLGISLLIIFFSLIYAHSKLVQKTAPIFTWFSSGFARINQLVSWLLLPLGNLLKLVWTGISALFKGAKKSPIESD